MSLASKVVINVAITGTVLYKKDCPALPTTVDEIVETARRVREAGAAIVHLHARNPDESPCYAPAVFRELVERVRAVSDLVVCVSLSGRFVQDVAVRAAGLAASPDLASLTLGSMNFIHGVGVNSPNVIAELASRVYAAGATPELEVFEAGFIHYANFLIRKNVLRAPYYFNFILGSLGTAPLDLVGLGHMVGMLPPGAVWSVGGLGQFQLDANVLGMAAGGHVRVGLEDNIYFDRGKTEPTDNVRLIARVVRIARELGREPASPAEAREILGLPHRHGT